MEGKELKLRKNAKKISFILIFVFFVGMFVLNFESLLLHLITYNGGFNLITKEQEVAITFDNIDNQIIDIEAESLDKIDSKITCTHSSLKEEAATIYEISFNNSFFENNTSIGTVLLDNKNNQLLFISVPVGVDILSSDGSKIEFESVTNLGISYPSSKLAIKIKDSELKHTDKIKIELSNLVAFKINPFPHK